MAVEANVQYYSAKAGADLSAKQHYIVKLDSTEDQVVLASAATDAILGVLQNKPTSGQYGSIAISGVTKVIAGGNVSAGNMVTADANGKAVATTNAGDSVLGMALTAAVSGDIFTILIMRFRY